MERRLRHCSLLVALTLLVASCAGGSRPAPAGSAAAPSNAAASASAPATAAAPAAPTTAAAPPPRAVVKIAATPSISNGGRYIAMERGYFAEEGIELEDVPSDTSAQLFPSLAAGQIDILSGGPTSGLFNAIAQGIPARIVLDQWTGFPGNEAGGIIARKELLDSGRLAQPADLRGLRLAMTAKGHVTQIVLDVVLKQGGVAWSEVEAFELSYPNMTTALGNNALDAAVSIEPYAAQAVGAGIAGRWKAWSEVIPNDAVALLMFSQSFADEKNDIAKRYAKAYVRGLRDYNDARTKGKDREQVIAWLQKHTPLKDRAIYDQMPWPSNNPDGRVNAEAIAATQDWFYEHGYVQTKIDLSRVIDHQFADYAVAQLGPYQP
jgi:NitT/TauT family transport system substrate-binding protein